MKCRRSWIWNLYWSGLSREYNDDARSSRDILCKLDLPDIKMPQRRRWCKRRPLRAINFAREPSLLPVICASERPRTKAVGRPILRPRKQPSILISASTSFHICTGRERFGAARCNEY